jgi:hypothetical protein
MARSKRPSKAGSGRSGTRRGRQKLEKADASAVADRLRKYVNERYKDPTAFARAVGIPRATAAGWRSSPPKTPETKYLIQLARQEGLSLNWLLLGEGPVSMEDTPLEAQLRGRIVAALAKTGLGDHEINRVVPNPRRVLKEVLLEGVAQYRLRALHKTGAGSDKIRITQIGTQRVVAEGDPEEMSELWSKLKGDKIKDFTVGEADWGLGVLEEELERELGGEEDEPEDEEDDDEDS